MKRYLLYFSFSYLFFNLACKQSSTPKESELGYDPIRLERIANVQQELINKGQIGSNQVIIYKDGQIIYDSIVNSNLEGDANITSKTIFPIWSMSKPITTVAVMMLFEEGKFMLDDPIEKYLPELSNLQCLDAQNNSYPCKNSVTIFDLLSHQSGWKYYPTRDDGEYLLIADTLYKNLEDFSQKMAEIPLKFEPSTRYLYGINTSILGRLIEVVSKQTLYNFMKENIFIPLEMHNTKFHLTKEDRTYLQPLFWTDGTPVGFYKSKYNEFSYNENSKVQLGGSGLVSTTSDYFNFCKMLLNKGQFNGKRILSPNTIKLMYQPINPELNYGTFTGFSTGFSLFNLTNPIRDGTLSPKGIFGWGGYHATLFWIDPENNLFGLVMDRGSHSAKDMFRKIRIATYQALN